MVKGTLEEVIGLCATTNSHFIFVIRFSLLG